jgi:hypothetical protein
LKQIKKNFSHNKNNEGLDRLCAIDGFSDIINDRRQIPSYVILGFALEDGLVLPCKIEKIP